MYTSELYIASILRMFNTDRLYHNVFSIGLGLHFHYELDYLVSKFYSYSVYSYNCEIDGKIKAETIRESNEGALAIKLTERIRAFKDICPCI
jgi:hypothetical protein